MSMTETEAHPPMEIEVVSENAKVQSADEMKTLENHIEISGRASASINTNENGHAEEDTGGGESLKLNEDEKGCRGESVNGIKDEIHLVKAALNTKLGSSVAATSASSSDKALLESRNKPDCGTPNNVPKKSNLKRPKPETPELNGSPTTSSKRIRIVENLDVANKNNYIQLEERSDKVLAADETASLSEVEACEEKIVWLNSTSSHIDQSTVNVEYVRDNLTPAKKNFSVEIDMRFTLTDTVSAILDCKAQISKAGSWDFHRWITQNSIFNSNQKMTILYKENFLKMANLDALLNYDLTSPKELTCENEEGIYYVGDFWHRSKGFREYMLWKTSSNQKLFSTKILAMKIVGPQSTTKVVSRKAGILFHNDGNPRPATDEEDLGHLPVEMVESHGGASDSMDILNLETINSFMHFVNLRTNEKGLHLLLVDNPELSYVYESCREVRFQKSFYCQCLIALRCVREGGTFICKFFDSFTLFTTGLLFLLYKCFKSITIHKPSSSNSNTSERFLICKGKIENADCRYAVDFLFDCLDMVVNNQEQRKIVRRRVRKRVAVLRMEVQALIPLKIILSHSQFFEFVRHSNIRFSTQLAESVQKLCKMIEGDEIVNLVSDGSAFVQKLSMWKIPFDTPLATDLLARSPLEQCRQFFCDNNITHGDTVITTVIGCENIKSLLSNDVWLAFPVQASSPISVCESIRGYFFGCGGTKMLYCKSNSWKVCEFLEFTLPYGTIVLGEVAEEICHNGNTRKFVRRFNIFDGLFLTGSYIGSLPFEKRHKILKRFTSCLRSPSNASYGVVDPLTLNEVPDFYKSTSKNFHCRGYGVGMRCYERSKYGNTSEKRVALVGGLLFVKNREDPSPDKLMKNYPVVWVWDKSEVDLGIKVFESTRVQPIAAIENMQVELIT